MSAGLTLHSLSEEGTRLVGLAVARTLAGGEVLALNGPLGAGKTQFVKGLAVGLDAAEADAVVSPTFVLVREYSGRLALVHVDAYRLGSAAELLELGLADVWQRPDCVVAIEWADRFADVLPAGAMTVELAYGTDQRSRTIRIRAAASIIGRLREELARCEGPVRVVAGGAHEAD